MEETKPPVTTVTRKTFGDEQEDQPLTITSIAAIALIVCISAPLLLVVGHALPLLDTFFNGMKPLMSYLGFGTGIAILALIGLFVWYAHDRFRVDIKKRIIEARKFRVDPQSGNYDAYFDTNKMFAIPKPGVTVPVVPQTYAPQLHFVNKGSSKKDEEVAELPMLGSGNVKPSVEELTSKIERDSLQVNLGRSLTNSQDLIADITTSHIKVIGITQMGKSCGIAALLTQVEQTHDPERLRFAILDLEDKTGKIIEYSDHVAVLDIGRGRQGRMHAKSIDEVPVYLRYIVDELERRYKLAPDELAQLPHILVYVEEFLDLKNRLKNKGGKVCDQFITDFTTLATRGLKAGLHIIASTQLDYADEDLREAMTQFSTLIAFRVKPTAAQSAGFMRHDLIKRNFTNSTPGQFVVEMIGLADIGIAPEFDVRAKLEALNSSKKTVVLGPKKTIVLSPEGRSQEGSNQLVNQDESTPEAMIAELEGETWQIEHFQWKLDQFIALLHETQDEQYRQIWKATPGSGREYKKARAERTALVKHAQSLLSSNQERR